MKAIAPFLTVLFLGIAATAGAVTPENPAVAPVRLFIDSFNKGDMKAAASALSPTDLVIIDDVAPHIWTGPNAFAAWSKSLEASDQAAGNTDGAVTLGMPTRVIVSADRAYVVAPAVYTFKKKGVAMREPAQLVCTLQKGSNGWLIASFTWAGSKPKSMAAAPK